MHQVPHRAAHVPALRPGARAHDRAQRHEASGDGQGQQQGHSHHLARSVSGLCQGYCGGDALTSKNLASAAVTFHLILEVIIILIFDPPSLSEVKKTTPLFARRVSVLGRVVAYMWAVGRLTGSSTCRRL